MEVSLSMILISPYKSLPSQSISIKSKSIEIICPLCSKTLQIILSHHEFSGTDGDLLVRRAIIHGDHVISVMVDREGRVRRKSAIPLVDSKRLKDEFNMGLMELLAHISNQSLIRKE